MPLLLDGEQRKGRSFLTRSGPLLMIDRTAYFAYVGYSIVPFTPAHVATFVEIAGVGVQTAEVGIFSTPAAPNQTPQALTKLVATGAVDGMLGAGMVRNTVAFATQIPMGVHVWVGIRASFTVTLPAISGVGADMGEGSVLVTLLSGALTGAGPFAGTVAAAVAAATPIAGDVRLQLD